jgi:hypothetical protein
MTPRRFTHKAILALSADLLPRGYTVAVERAS